MADGINVRQGGLFNVPAKLFFDSHQQFNPLHGIEAKIELEIIVGRMYLGRSLAGFANHFQRLLHFWLVQPLLIFSA